MVTMTTPTTATGPELVGVAEIAERLKVPRSTVSMWDSRRATNSFPRPVERLSMGPVYEWDAVQTWARQRVLRQASER